MMSSTQSMIKKLLDNSKEVPRPRTSPPPNPTPQNQQPSSPSTTQTQLLGELKEINDPKGLLERNHRSSFTLSWQAKQSALGKGTLEELRKHKEELNMRSTQAANFLAQKERQKQADLDAILAKKNPPKLAFQPGPATKTPLLSPSPVRASGKFTIRF